MWTRVDLKNRCKAVMKRNYWQMFFVGLIILLLDGIAGIDFESSHFDFINSFVVSLSIVLILAKFFVFNPISCGASRFYLLNIESNQKVSEIFYYFSHDYFNVVKIMFLVDLKIFLWTLLLIIPGIIKSFEYSMIPYIIAENSSIDSKEAFARTKVLTNGFKMDMLILSLSFFGWIILGVITIVGTVFIAPYIYGVDAELYVALKEIEDRN